MPLQLTSEDCLQCWAESGFSGGFALGAGEGVLWGAGEGPAGRGVLLAEVRVIPDRLAILLQSQPAQSRGTPRSSAKSLICTCPS